MTKESTIGDYYDQKRKDADRIIAALEKAMLEETNKENRELIRRLKAELELARYVGD